MSDNVYIFAKITPKPEFYDLAKAAIVEIIPQTRAEGGCIEFTLHEDTNGNLCLYEQWVDNQALQLHHDMAYTKSVFESYKTWLAAAPEINQLAKVS